MGEKVLNGIDAIEFIGKVLIVSPLLVALFGNAMSALSQGPTMDFSAVSAMFMFVGIICIVYVSIKRYHEGKDSVK